MTSAGFEAANSGTRGSMLTTRPPKPFTHTLAKLLVFSNVITGRHEVGPTQDVAEEPEASSKLNM